MAEVGDKVTVSCGSHEEKGFGTVLEKPYGAFDYKVRTRICICDGFDEYEITTYKETTKLGDVVKRIKNLALSKEDKLLRKYDLVSEAGDLTDQGFEVVKSLLLETYRDQLVKAAEELAKEDKTKA